VYLTATVKYYLRALTLCGSLLAASTGYAQPDWVQKATPIGPARACPGVFTIGTNAYLGVGYNGAMTYDFYKYDGLTNTWSILPGYPGVGSWGISSFAMEGKGYFGWGAASPTLYANDLWQYDPIANTWKAMASCPCVPGYSAANFVLGHKAWFICNSTGGPPYNPDVWMYDSHTNSWTKKANYPGGSNEAMLGFAIGNRGYAGTGWDGSANHNNMYMYDTTSDTWTPIANFPGGGTGFFGGSEAAYVIGTKAYVIYGDDQSLQPITQAWIYDTVTKGWCSFSHLLKVRRAYSASFLLNGKGYLCWGTDSGGSYVGPYNQNLYEYDPIASIGVSDTNLCITPSVKLSCNTTFDMLNTVNFSWTMPGGTPGTSTAQNPTVTYSPGTYTVTLIVSNCATADTVTRVITVIGSSNLPVTLKGNLGICTGMTDTISASGGTSYLWSNGATTSQIIVTPASNTTYTVHVTDGACHKDTTFSVLVGAKLPVVITGPPAICPGANATLTASGGTGYTYLWNNGATTSSITVNPTVNTTYSVVVSNGTCTGDTSFNVAIIPFPKLTLTASPATICTGDSTTLSISGASTYVWSNGSTNSSIVVKPMKDSTYTVSASNGVCTVDTSIRVVVNVTPVAVVTGNNILCYGNSTTLNASGGESYTWIPATGLNCDSCPAVQASPTTTTSYSVVAHNGNCNDTAVVKITVSAQPKGSVCCSDTIQMGDSTLITSSDSAATSYAWSPNTSLSCAICPSAYASPQFTTTYTVVMSDSGGCDIVDSVRIFVEGCSTVWIPNAFTPNGDGLNDKFAPEGVCMVSYTMDIFDRWGNLVYTTDASKPWDGTYKGSDKIVETDTYVYLIIATDGYKKTHKYRGKVTVMR
jgi:gliding motility-associated-like protein